MRPLRLAQLSPSVLRPQMRGSEVSSVKTSADCRPFSGPILCGPAPRRASRWEVVALRLACFSSGDFGLVIPWTTWSIDAFSPTCRLRVRLVSFVIAGPPEFLLISENVRCVDGPPSTSNSEHREIIPARDEHVGRPLRRILNRTHSPRRLRASWCPGQYSRSWLLPGGHCCAGDHNLASVLGRDIECRRDGRRATSHRFVVPPNLGHFLAAFCISYVKSACRRPG
jgi:hypothetical protein